MGFRPQPCHTGPLRTGEFIPPPLSWPTPLNLAPVTVVSLVPAARAAMNGRDAGASHLAGVLCTPIRGSRATPRGHHRHHHWHASVVFAAAPRPSLGRATMLQDHHPCHRRSGWPTWIKRMERMAYLRRRSMAVGLCRICGTGRGRLPHTRIGLVSWAQRQCDLEGETIRAGSRDLDMAPA